MTHPLIEQLESKRFLSATIDDGIVTVIGTDQADKIDFWFGAEHPDRFIIHFDGGPEFSFARSDIRLVRINGEGGDDRIQPLNVSGVVNLKLSLDGGTGSDLLVGGSNKDTMVGGPGNDDMRGGTDVDTVDYSGASSTFISGNGLEHGIIASINGIPDDREAGGTDNIEIDIENIVGTNFRDNIFGDDDGNTLMGLGGPDQIFGGPGKDRLEGGSGANNIVGGSNADTLIGGSGQSTLEGDGGNDSLGGGTGDELLAGGPGRDRYNGGEGFDTADFRGEKSAFNLNFDNQFNDGPGDHIDNFIELNELFTSSSNNRIDLRKLKHGFHIKATGGGVLINGSEFADHIEMEGGTANGLGGNDDIDGGFSGTARQNVIDGGSGNDFIRTADGPDNITGGKGDDSITSGDGNDSINGGPDRDTVRASGGDDYVRGDGSTDHLFGDEGNDTVLGQGSVNDFLTGGNGTDTFETVENDNGWVTDFDRENDRLIKPPDMNG